PNAFPTGAEYTRKPKMLQETFGGFTTEITSSSSLEQFQSFRGSIREAERKSCSAFKSSLCVPFSAHV
ncbi:MAG: hypothetical protein KGO02_20240, partial [Alphaproteobacteria bacterium]|nr:hypothetical protein [Alphaproteobacteria bacterium]